MDSDGRLILSSRSPVQDSRLESTRCCWPRGPTDRLLCSDSPPKACFRACSPVRLGRGAYKPYSVSTALKRREGDVVIPGRGE